MALKPTDEKHAIQIQAGTLGRKTGHKFEDTLTANLNSIPTPYINKSFPEKYEHLFVYKPEISLLRYICSRLNISELTEIISLSTGALATSEDGKKWLNVNGVKVSKCKSDVIITLKAIDKQEITVGISTKQCNNKTPTNAQLFFTMAKAFCNLLRENNLKVSDDGEKALRQFCGDEGFRPQDYPNLLLNRKSDPRKFFWEEIDIKGKTELENLFTENQDKITRLLLQKAYLDDPFAPDFLLHKTKKSES
ncbi:MAG: hypothetical protein ACR2MD_10680 [Aridibacter sp.]